MTHHGSKSRPQACAICSLKGTLFSWENHVGVGTAKAHDHAIIRLAPLLLFNSSGLPTRIATRTKPVRSKSVEMQSSLKFLAKWRADARLAVKPVHRTHG